MRTLATLHCWLSAVRPHNRMLQIASPPNRNKQAASSLNYPSLSRSIDNGPVHLLLISHRLITMRNGTLPKSLATAIIIARGMTMTVLRQTATAIQFQGEGS
ncbi:hypothetical protein Zmor_025704 [Zophobas morio]|uniref:Uncharacterized protein n=1 Tax=Zophobas morio TaxID=2755281 RepID=A0AA38HXL5_9CUCU|nr:hypothetical protein Zmor_025704 [Zophobas morio]